MTDTGVTLLPNYNNMDLTFTRHDPHLPFAPVMLPTFDCVVHTPECTEMSFPGAHTWNHGFTVPLGLRILSVSLILRILSVPGKKQKSRYVRFCESYGTLVSS